MVCVEPATESASTTMTSLPAAAAAAWIPWVTSAKPRSSRLGTISPRVSVRRVRRPRANAFGR